MLKSKNGSVYLYLFCLFLKMFFTHLIKKGTLIKNKPDTLLAGRVLPIEFLHFANILEHQSFECKPELKNGMRALL